MSAKEVLTYKMHLSLDNFIDVSNGSKQIEARLYDEKRQKIDVGDKILFYNLNNSNEMVSVKVVDLFYYTAIRELVNFTPIKYWGTKFTSKEQLLEAKWPYTDEEIKKYGLLAIQIELM